MGNVRCHLRLRKGSVLFRMLLFQLAICTGGAVWSDQADSCPYLMHMYAACSYAYNIYIYTYILSGKRLQFAIEAMAIEIVDLPIQNDD